MKKKPSYSVHSQLQTEIIYHGELRKQEPTRNEAWEENQKKARGNRKGFIYVRALQLLVHGFRVPNFEYNVSQYVLFRHNTTKLDILFFETASLREFARYNVSFTYIKKQKINNMPVFLLQFRKLYSTINKITNNMETMMI